MTKYILVGGYPRKAKDKGRALVKEMTKGFLAPKILLCYFARPEVNWKESFAEDKKFFQKFETKKNLKFKMAKPKSLERDVKWANAIYLRGGNTHKLLKALRNDKRWTGHLDKKTIAGSSAGAYVLAKYSYDFEVEKLEKGLNLLPVKVLVHFMSDYGEMKRSDWTRALSALKKSKEKLPTYALKEGEFVVIKQ